MIIPLGDDNSDRTTTPWVTCALLAINVLVFALLQQLGADADFTYSYSAVPEEIPGARPTAPRGRRQAEEGG